MRDMETMTQTTEKGFALPVRVTRRKDIPASPLYVTATIPFLSGWGEADGKTARGIYPVPDHNTARKVMTLVKENLKATHIHLCATRPEVRETSVYTVYDYRGML